MATLSGRVIFDRDRSASLTSGDTGIASVPVVLQDLSDGSRLTVLTASDGTFLFTNVPAGSYRLVESYGQQDGVPSPGSFANAVSGPVPEGMDPPLSLAIDPPAGANHLDSLTPDTLLLTVSGADLSNLYFFDGPVIYTPIQTSLDPCAVISGENLIQAADGGTFGTFPAGTPANTGAPAEPYPGVTPDFTYVLPDPEVYTPFGGEYTVQNIMNNALSEAIGAWWRIADHTAGNETGRMMVVNGYNPGAVFFREQVTVTPNTSYLFTAWILNLFRVGGYPDPRLGVRVTAQDGSILYSATLGTEIPVSPAAPQWKQIGSVLNSRNNTSLTVEFLSEGPEVIGNDYAIDDISLNEIQIPTFVPQKTVDSSTAAVGDTVTFTVTLSNPCESPLTGLCFRDPVPAGLSFLPGSVEINGEAAGTADPNAGFSLPDLPGGQTVTISFSAVVSSLPEPNPVSNQAFFQYAYTPVPGGIPGAYETASNMVTVLVQPPTESGVDLQLQKTVSPAFLFPGDCASYTLILTNAGPDTARQAVIVDPLSPALTGACVSVVNGGSQSQPQPWRGSYAAGDLAPGASVILRITGRIDPCFCGVLENTAAAYSLDQELHPENNTASAVLTVRRPPCWR